jgi:hypothetical protein
MAEHSILLYRGIVLHNRSILVQRPGVGTRSYVELYPDNVNTGTWFFFSRCGKPFSYL